MITKVKQKFDIVAALRSMEFFRNMEPTHLHKLADIVSETDFAKGDIIYREGDLDKSLYLVQKGKVVIEMKGADESYATVFAVEPGQLFGWSSLFAGQRKRARARTVKTTRAYIIDGDQLNDLFESDHKLEHAVMQRMIKLVGERVYATRQQLVDSASTSS